MDIKGRKKGKEKQKEKEGGKKIINLKRENKIQNNRKRENKGKT